ncbi:MAG TPA: PilZ domain-containing protein [Nitrospira sp.]|nr:PilZ domain-containing protein [Nitrospira sp.]
MSHRQHERFLIEFPATFAGECGGLGIVYNLGMGGCKIVTDRPPAAGSMLALDLKIPQQTSAITIRMATVRWTMHYKLGVEFLGMEELERERFALFLQGLEAAIA